MPSLQTTDAGKLGSWSIRTVKPWTASAPHEANCPCVHCTLQRDSDTRLTTYDAPTTELEAIAC